MHGRRRIAVPVVVLVVAIAVSAWYLNRPVAPSGALAASGTVAATTICGAR